MKKVFYLISVLTITTLAQGLFADAKSSSKNFAKFTKEVVYDDNKYDYDVLVSQISGVSAPRLVKGDNRITDKVIFTADSNARFTGIVFDFENFKTIHPFSVRKTRDVDGNETSSFQFFVLNLPKDLTHLQYRLIVDGLWTVDPQNPNSAYDIKTGMKLSQLDLNRTIEPATEILRGDSARTRQAGDNNGSPIVHFVFKGKSGQKVRIAGNFTNWDSWIYELEEVEPGLYELDLPLTAGTWTYSYYSGISSFIDSTNPERAYTPDGRIASVITVH